MRGLLAIAGMLLYLRIVPSIHGLHLRLIVVLSRQVDAVAEAKA